MAYTPELQKMIKFVEKTRPARVEKKRAGEEFPAMSLKERDEILKYHPDFMEEGRSVIKIGPSKGYRIAHEIVDLLHAKSRVHPELIYISKADYETDVLIIGGGGGCCC